MNVPGTGASFTCSAPDDEYSTAIGCPYLNISFAGCDIPATFDTGLSNPMSDNKNHDFNDNMDFFFNTFIQSGRVSSVRDLMGPGNEDRPVEESSRVYAIAVAQVFSAK